MRLFMKKTQKKSKFDTLKRLIPFYKPYKWEFALDLFFALIMSICALIFPILVRRLLYDVLGDGNVVLSSLLWISAAILGIKILEYAAKYFVTTVGHVTGSKIETDIRMSLFEKLLRLPNSFFDDRKVGDLMSRLTTDLFDITEFCHHCPEELFIAAVKLVGIFCYLITVNVPLTILLFATMPFIIWFSMIFNRKMRNNWRLNRAKISEINSHIENSLSGIRVIKSFATEAEETEKFLTDNHEFVEIKKKNYRFMGGFQSVTGLLSNLLYVVTAVFGAVLIGRGELKTEDLITYLLYINTLLTTINTLVNFSEQFQQGFSGFSRYCDLMDEPETIFDSASATELTDISGNIDYENVTFSYSAAGEKVLSDVTLNIKKGQNVAIVGPSGAGKTTLVNLLPRFYDTTGGNIFIDGINVKDVTLKSLRKNIGVVQQDVYIFNGTIRVNIAYGNSDKTDEEIETAAKLAGAEEFINKLPHGYDTEVGDRGVKLSGGQKQRISIARVFLKNPPILILDEATSSLDNESERIVQKSLDMLARSRTTLTIAHRLSTVRNADRIIVLTENGIEEQGTHDELLAKHGIYYGLYNS